MAYQVKVLFFIALSFGKVWAEEQNKPECDVNSKRAIALSATCCQLTRPSTNPDIRSCRTEVMETFRKKTNFTRSEKLALNICIEECLFINNGYINPDPPYYLDMNFVGERLNEIMPEPKTESVPFMLRAYETCGKFRSQHPTKLNINYPDLTITDNVCATYPLEVTSCVRILGMQKCPTVFLLETKECLDAMTYFNECVAQLL